MDSTRSSRTWPTRFGGADPHPPRERIAGASPVRSARPARLDRLGSTGKGRATASGPRPPRVRANARRLCAAWARPAPDRQAPTPWGRRWFADVGVLGLDSATVDRVGLQAVRATQTLVGRAASANRCLAPRMVPPIYRAIGPAPYDRGPTSPKECVVVSPAGEGEVSGCLSSNRGRVGAVPSSWQLRSTSCARVPRRGTGPRRSLVLAGAARRTSSSEPAAPVARVRRRSRRPGRRV